MACICLSLLISLGFGDVFLSIHEQRKRVALLMTAALLEGASVGPLIELAVDIDPRYVILTRSMTQAMLISSFRIYLFCYQF